MQLYLTFYTCVFHPVLNTCRFNFSPPPLFLTPPPSPLKLIEGCDDVISFAPQLVLLQDPYSLHNRSQGGKLSFVLDAVLLNNSFLHCCLNHHILTVVVQGYRFHEQTIINEYLVFLVAFSFNNDFSLISVLEKR